MEKKLYAYNDGLRSRFASLIFEDFEEDELKDIWEHFVEDRGWYASPEVRDVVARRLAKRSGQKGFGNARDVRSMFDSAVKAAMSREDFDGTLELRIIDAIGTSSFREQEVESHSEGYSGKTTKSYYCDALSLFFSDVWIDK